MIGDIGMKKPHTKSEAVSVCPAKQMFCRELSVAIPKTNNLTKNKTS